MDTRFTLNALVPLLSTHLGNSHCSNQGTLIDLAELDTPSSSSPALAPPTSGIPILPPPPQTSGPPRSRSSSQAEAPPGPESMNNALSLLDEELLCLGSASMALQAWHRGRKAQGLVHHQGHLPRECRVNMAASGTAHLSFWEALQSCMKGKCISLQSGCRGTLSLQGLALALAPDCCWGMGGCCLHAGAQLIDFSFVFLGLTDPAPTAPKESPGSSQWHLFQVEAQ